MKRDFTYVDDIVNGIVQLLDFAPSTNTQWDSNNPDPATSFASYQLFNIGANNPINLMDYIGAIEKKLGKKAVKNFLPMQSGEVLETFADTSHLALKTNYKPQISLTEGISNFVDWYQEYYSIKQ